MKIVGGTPGRTWVRWEAATERARVARLKRVEAEARARTERVLPREAEAAAMWKAVASVEAAMEAATARETAEKAVAKWKNLLEPFQNNLSII